MVLCFILIKNKWFVLLFIWGLSHGSNRSNINWFVHIHVICWIIEINGCFYNVTKSISIHYQAWYPWGSLQLCFQSHKVFVKGRSSVCRVSLGTRSLDKYFMKLALNVFSIKDVLYIKVACNTLTSIVALWDIAEQWFSVVWSSLKVKT